MKTNKLNSVIIKILLPLFLMVFSYAKAQTILIPDDGFKACLVAKYPSLVTDEEELILSEANSFSDTLECINRGIIDLSSIEQFTSVTVIDFSDNNIVDATIIDELINLKSISFRSNELDTISVTNLSELETIDISENELEHMIDLSIPTRIDISDNDYENLPVFNFSTIEVLDLSGNEFTFEDFIEFIDESIFPDNFPDFEIQSNPGRSSEIVLEEGEDWVWTLGFDESVDNNTYSWFRNDTLVEVTTIGVFTIESVELSDSGVYRCEIVNDNPKLSNVLLTSKPQTLIVTESTVVEPPEEEEEPECFIVQEASFTIEIPACEEIAFVSVSSLVSNGVQGDLKYILRDGANEKVQVNSNFDLLTEGTYELVLADDVCEQNTNQVISISFDLENCEPRSFSPNGDGLDETFYIDGAGKAIIYDRNGLLIKTLNLPTFWDGTNNRLEQVNLGHYIIIINDEEKRAVTLIR